MKEQLINFKTAKLAKEKGFNEKCLYHYESYDYGKSFHSIEPDEIYIDKDNKLYHGGGSVLEHTGVVSVIQPSIKIDYLYLDSEYGPCTAGKYKAPTQSLLQTWLRNKKKISVSIFDYFGREIHYKYIINGVAITGLSNIWETPDKEFNSYEEALEAGLFKALKLIKKNKI